MSHPLHSLGGSSEACGEPDAERQTPLCGQVLGGVGGHHTAAEGHHLMMGNIFLLLNTLAMALYYLR